MKTKEKTYRNSEYTKSSLEVNRIDNLHKAEIRGLLPMNSNLVKE